MTDQPAGEESRSGSLDGRMVAVIPVRSGVLPLGADEAVAEAGGFALLIGSDCVTAAEQLDGQASAVRFVELGRFSARRWADAAAEALQCRQNDVDRSDSNPMDLPSESCVGHLLLPGSPDGRDLGPHLAAATGREFVAGAIAIDTTAAQVTRYGGQVTDVLRLERPTVATMQPGIRGVEPAEGPAPEAVEIRVETAVTSSGIDPRLLEELPADPSTMDLAEADRIVGGGAGLGSPEAFDELRRLAERLGASPGGTRVVTDWGWLPVERQIGTTGVNVNPSLYLALGISGAVQHTAGLGAPDHVISVNRDPHCPMMAMADLAIVSDGPEFLRHLLERLDEADPEPPPG